MPQPLATLSPNQSRLQREPIRHHREAREGAVCSGGVDPGPGHMQQTANAGRLCEARLVALTDNSLLRDGGQTARPQTERGLRAGMVMGDRLMFQHERWHRV